VAAARECCFANYVALVPQACAAVPARRPATIAGARCCPALHIRGGIGDDKAIIDPFTSIDAGLVQCTAICCTPARSSLVVSDRAYIARRAMVHQIRDAGHVPSKHYIL
jgi:hypothetical protein